jgi:hypothetical protein
MDGNRASALSKARPYHRVYVTPVPSCTILLEKFTVAFPGTGWRPARATVTSLTTTAWLSPVRAATVGLLAKNCLDRFVLANGYSQLGAVPEQRLSSCRRSCPRKPIVLVPRKLTFAFLR